MTNLVEIPELKKVCRIAELSPFLLVIDVLFVFVAGCLLALSGFVNIFLGIFEIGEAVGLGHSFITAGIWMALAGVVIAIVGYFLGNWLDGIYFKNLAILARFGHDHFGRHVQWLAAKSFAENRGYGLLFKD